MTKILLMIASFVCVAPCLVASDFLDGNTLQDACNTPDSKVCDMYIYGVSDGYTLGSDGGYCPKPGVTNGQLEKYLNDHPERLHEMAAILLINSWQAAFPCGSSGVKPRK